MGPSDKMGPVRQCVVGTTGGSDVSRRNLLLVLGVACALICGLLLPAVASADPAATDWGRMPLYFVQNQGQSDSAVSYYVQGQDKSVYFTPQGLTFALTEKGAAPWAVKLDFLGARAVAPAGVGETGAVISYFKGSADQWKTGLPTYSSVSYSDLWPGIDLVYSGTDDRLKHQFVVAPGADPANIRLGYRGAAVTLNDAGQLVVSTPVASFTDDAPVAYQEVQGARVPVSARYVLEPSTDGDQVSYSFRVGAYDRSLPLVIDPAVIVYCGFIGGSEDENGAGIAVDASGCAYIAGSTVSTEASFPEKAGPDLSYNGGDVDQDLGDAWVAKVKADGTGLVYCGYIGGSGYEFGNAIAVDSSGCAYVVGSTTSTAATFPDKGGPDLIHNGGDDAFIAKVSTTGTSLVYCGYVGGSQGDGANGVKVDSAGHAFIAGWTFSSAGTFPEKGGPDLIYNGAMDAFVAEVAISGSSLLYCGYVGGSGDDQATGIAVDTSGRAYISGWTNSSQSSFPEKVGPDLTYNGGDDAFVAKVAIGGGSLIYCGYVGGSGSDDAMGVAVDSAGAAYITGTTGSTQATFPEKGGPDLAFNGGGSDAYVAKVNPDGLTLAYCGYIGGNDRDSAYGIALDPGANAYVIGQTFSTAATFPEKSGPDLTPNGADFIYFGDAFVAKVLASGSSLSYCGYLGGDDNDKGLGIAVDSAGAAYVTGWTTSFSNFPVTVGPDLSHNLAVDAFVSKIVVASHGRHEQTDGDIVKWGTWTDFAATGASGGSYGRSSTSGASATIYFNGTQIDYYGMKGTTTGVVAVFLDGVKKATIDLAAPSAIYNTKIWSSGTIPAGNHTLQLVRSSLSAASEYLTLDAVDIWGTLRAAP